MSKIAADAVGGADTAVPAKSGLARLGVWVALAVFVYGVGYLIWYLGTPLGQAPQLDGRENLELAKQIAIGALPHELFYRAMVYPAVLAVPLLLGWPASWLPVLAAVGGLLCHFTATLAVARLAARWWVGPSAGLAAALAAALWGLNPVALFYAVDVLDVTPAMALFLWALVWLSRPGGRGRESLAGGALLGLAVGMRPHFLPVVLVAPVARAWLAGRWRPTGRDGLAWVGAAVPLLAVGWAQWAWAGEFRVLPWQGAYNFYAANRRGANGRYYTQRVFLGDIAPGENPTRRESDLLYAQETQAQPPFAISAMEGYWHAQALGEIAENPVAWLELMGRKTYYLFNDFDQYNNKTYAWHQQESPWLRWNYLSWGILFVLMAGMLPAAMNADPDRRRVLAGMMLVFAAYGAGVLLYYASGRFRLPLAPLLCVTAGGWAIWRETLASRGRMLAAGGWMLAAGLLTFSDFYSARDESTFIQDELLSANAAAETGADAQAYALAEQVLTRNPSRPDARRIALVSYFNLAVESAPGMDSAAGWRKQLPLLQGLELRDPTLALVAGVAWWKAGDARQAAQAWQQGAASFGANSPPGQALVAARYLLKAAGPGSTSPPNKDYVEYLTRPN